MPFPEQQQPGDRYQYGGESVHPAEQHGWAAVTVRKLAERIEYSQPVLYSHFAGKSAIVSAVAEQGFGELGRQLRDIRTAAADPETALVGLVRGYLAFAAANPALYDAMFLLNTDLTFGPDAPAALRDAFAEIAAAYAPFTGSSAPESGTEVAWSMVHGLATLERAGRLRPDFREQRIAIACELLTARPV
ncbi:TetR family transcriptional regulator [Nocardia donostiensis]|uniref:TetR family transcriptional regulator n=1 Tax=Nocardia donostiensis TaxID=1538463 RepID=A0A1V2T9F3_9NOCA|nr:TetR family transcriptional regulator [Nocardia donostiensis]OQS12605.1 TetR family transcriptional regulator [Nocardia donostiensis]OQS17501.1 TetR family transcriptional regulator [Nocardia donostiensis]